MLAPVADVTLYKRNCMKKAFTYIALSLLVIANSGCLKEAKDRITGGNMTATVNGEYFKAHNVAAFSGSGHFSMDGTTADGKLISFYIPDASTLVESYSIDKTVHKAWYYVNNSAKPDTAISGTITIRYRNTNAVYGTFAFVCKDGTQVLNGSYDANWP